MPAWLYSLRTVKMTLRRLPTTHQLRQRGQLDLRNGT